MLNGRCVVVTGASGNLGTVVSARLEREGAKVFGIDRAVADVTDEAQVEKAYDAAVAKFGPLWGAVHTAGTWAGGLVAETSVATFEKMIAVNLRTTFLCCRAAVRRMLRRCDYSWTRTAPKPAIWRFDAYPQAGCSSAAASRRKSCRR